MQGPSGKVVGESSEAAFFRPWNNQARPNFLITDILGSEVEEIVRDVESAGKCAKAHGSDSDDSESVASCSSTSSELNFRPANSYSPCVRVRKVRRKLFNSESEESLGVTSASEGDSGFSSGPNEPPNPSGEIGGYYTSGIPCSLNVSSENPNDTYGSMSATMRSRYTFPSTSIDYLAQYEYLLPNAELWLRNRSEADQVSFYLGLTAPSCGNYGLCMTDAVEQLYQQDIAVKQQRKLRPKKFRCEHCNVAFSNNGQLKGHVRIHTGERPFKCEVSGCNKAFTRNEELTRHRKIHTGLKPHTCNMCGKSFGRKDHLKKHQRTHQNRGIPEPFSGTIFGYGGPHYTCLPSGQPLPAWHYSVCA